ncbi:MAG: radical SAM protein [bacterium]
MAKEENKTQASHSRPLRPFSSLQNFSDYIEAEGTTRGEDDSDIRIKETEVDTSISAYPADKIPIQIRRLQLYKEGLKNLQLKPSYVQWLCTDQCQFRCDHCDMRVSKPSLDGLATQEMIKALDTLSFLGCDTFSVIGGDPLLRNDLFDVLDYAKRKGMKIALTTHTYDIERFLHKIEQAQLDSIMVSIDGYRFHHDQIRGKEGDYEKCLQCLRVFYDIDIPVIGVSILVMDENIHDIPKIIDDVYTYGGNRLQIQPLLFKKRNRPQIVKEALRQIYYARFKGFNIEASEGFGYLGYMETLFRSSNFFCGCGWDTFTIMPDGKIMGCTALNSSNHAEGNIKEDDLQSVWYSKFNRFRDDIPEDLPSNCKACPYLQMCRGGCWLFRAYSQDPCFLRQAEEVVAQIFS